MATYHLCVPQSPFPWLFTNLLHLAFPCPFCPITNRETNPRTSFGYSTFLVCIHQGGFIFPLFFAGASFGRALLPLAKLFLPISIVNVTPVLITMSFAAGLNVAVTRTPFASPLILAVLSGQPNIAAPVTCASLASLFITRSAKFISPQTDRADLQFVGDLQPLQEPSLPAGKVKGDVPDAEKGSLLNGAAVNGSYSAIVTPDAQMTTSIPV